MHIILSVNEDAIIGVNIPAKKCICLKNDNTKYEIDLTVDEIELYFTLKNLQNEIGQIKTDKLRKKIENYKASADLLYNY
jgi:hypothetical protein